jgi:hypothetical protein
MADVITASGIVAVARPMRVPLQRTRRGKASYRGSVEVIDLKHPHISYVQSEPDEDEPVDAEEAKDAGERVAEVETKDVVAAPKTKERKPRSRKEQDAAADS